MIKVVAAVLEKEGKILLAKRKAKDLLASKWEFPGGKIEPGETPEECLKRELFEEFSIETEIGEFIYSSTYHYPHVSIELLAFKATFISGTFVLHAHEGIRWVRKEELADYDLSGADIPIAKYIAQKNKPSLEG